MNIQDEELRNLFKLESEEYLQRLDEGLLRLEADPHDHAALEAVFRDAHSLKGAARMLGMTEIETVAHRFEDVLGQAKRRQTVLDPPLIDRLYRGLDGMRHMVTEAVSDTPQPIDMLAILDILQDAPAGEEAHPPNPDDPRSSGDPPEHSPSEGISNGPQPRQEEHSPQTSETALPDALATPRIEEAAQEKPPEHEPRPQPATGSPRRYQIDSIRVDTRKLDALMTQAGELSIAAIRIGQRLSDIAQLVTAWEEWNRDLQSYRSTERAAQEPAHLNAAKTLARLHQQESERLGKLGGLIEKLSRLAYEDHQHLEAISRKLDDGIRSTRLLPLSTIFQLFPRMVRDLERELGKRVALSIEGDSTRVDKHILEEMKDPLIHMLRNAMDHGIESPDERVQAGKPPEGTLRLNAYQTATSVIIELCDDGRGLDLEAIKEAAIKRNLYREQDLRAMTPRQIQMLIFAPGFSTRSSATHLSGRGVGLDVVHTQVQRLKGTIHVSSTKGRGCTVQIRFPVSLTTTRILIASVDHHAYGIPMEYVRTTQHIKPQDIAVVEGRETTMINGELVPLTLLSSLLEVKSPPWALPTQERKPPPSSRDSLPCMVLAIGDERLGCIVDELVDEQEVIQKSLGPALQRVRNVSGSTILSTGEVCIILNPEDVIRSAQIHQSASIRNAASTQPCSHSSTVLFVDDSLIIRTRVARILEEAGYRVETAEHGKDALEALHRKAFDVLISDIEMPYMDGISLVRTLRGDPRFSALPIILFSSLNGESERNSGMAAGATAYVHKRGFGEQELIHTLKGLHT